MSRAVEHRNLVGSPPVRGLAGLFVGLVLLLMVVVSACSSPPLPVGPSPPARPSLGSLPAVATHAGPLLSVQLTPAEVVVDGVPALSLPSSKGSAADCGELLSRLHEKRAKLRGLGERGVDVAPRLERMLLGVDVDARPEDAGLVLSAVAEAGFGEVWWAVNEWVAGSQPQPGVLVLLELGENGPEGAAETIGSGAGSGTDSLATVLLETSGLSPSAVLDAARARAGDGKGIRVLIPKGASVCAGGGEQRLGG